jgi:hypothetical protein
MGCCNEPATAQTGLPVDPSQHVNYERGMVLGVDDFTQEFAYLSGRDQWLARDLLGYGTASGLNVFAENEGPEGPRLHVTAGSALVPSGKLVCVPADQCAVLNRWLAKPANAALVSRLLNPASPPTSPPSFSPPLPPLVETGTIALFLTLCYARCTTRPVPIPGEPCRSEDELMKDSRIADDFRLELREHAPVQTEEDAVRDFVRWLRANVLVDDDASPPPIADEAAWLGALRNAAQPWLASPPASFATLGDYLFDLSPPGLSVARADLGDFLRVALRFWVTELRPLWMAFRCHKAQHADVDCVLLARVSFEVGWIGGSPSGAWQVTGSPVELQIDQAPRPILGHARLLQEWTAGEGIAAAGGSLVGLTLTSTNLTLGATHHFVIARGGAGLQITLPASAASETGRSYVIKNSGTAALTVRAAAATTDRIESTASVALPRLRAITLVSDGAGQWLITARG